MGLINGSLIDSGLSDLAWIEKYQKLEQQLSQLQQEKEELIKYKNAFEELRHKVMDRAKKDFNTKEESAIWWTLFDFVIDVGKKHGIEVE